MFRSLLLAGFVAISASALTGQQIVQSRGVPASITSPTPGPNGIVVSHGIPASIFSPIPRPPLVNPVPRGNGRPGIQVTGSRRVGFGNPHHKQIVPVPVFYPVYGYGGVYSDYDVPPPADHYVNDLTANPAADDNSESASNPDTQALQRAYYQGAHDALAQEQQQEQGRYGQHYLDSREPSSKPAQPETAPAPQVAQAPQQAQQPESESDSTPAVFIFKDGHRVETNSYAIMGTTLYDFSSKRLKKIQLTDLDKDATTKANDDRGVSVTLP